MSDDKFFVRRRSVDNAEVHVTAFRAIRKQLVVGQTTILLKLSWHMCDLRDDVDMTCGSVVGKGKVCHTPSSLFLGP